jgi:tetratricopeptide (TPR) repeat protein
LRNLGNAYCLLGDYAKAIESYEQSLTIAREIEDRQGEEQVRVKLVNAYCALGDYANAIECNQQHLTIVQAT